MIGMVEFAKREKRKENRTGTSTQPKERMEQRTRLSFDDVRANPIYLRNVATNTDKELERQTDEISLDDRVDISLESEIIQCAPNPIVSDFLRKEHFDETHYLTPGPILYTLFIDKEKFSTDLQKQLDAFFKELNYNGEFEFQIPRKEFKDILMKYAGIRALIAGNCGELANFLYEVEENPEPSVGNFDAFIKELEQEVPENMVKLIRAQSNIGHAFTLICYRQDENTIVELIQAWLGKYSVTDSLSSANYYTNHELAKMFNDMHESLNIDSSKKYFKHVFLLDNDKKIDKFEIMYYDSKILHETPEEYAKRIASKGM